MLCHVIDGLDQRSYVSIGECESLVATLVVGMLRDVIGHHHVWIAYFLVDHHGFDEVDIALVRVGLRKIVAFAARILRKCTLKIFLRDGTRVT